MNGWEMRSLWRQTQFGPSWPPKLYYPQSEDRLCTSWMNNGETLQGIPSHPHSSTSWLLLLFARNKESHTSDTSLRVGNNRGCEGLSSHGEDHQKPVLATMDRSHPEAKLYVEVTTSITDQQSIDDNKFFQMIGIVFDNFSWLVWQATRPNLCLHGLEGMVLGLCKKEWFLNHWMTTGDWPIKGVTGTRGAYPQIEYRPALGKQP